MLVLNRIRYVDNVESGTYSSYVSPLKGYRRFIGPSWRNSKSLLRYILKILPFYIIVHCERNVLET